MGRLGCSVSFSVLALSACLANPAMPTAQKSDTTPTDHKTADKAEKSVLNDDFVYVSQNKRDPFRSFLAEVSEQRVHQHQARKLEKTEMFELTDYHLTGLMTGISQPKAMVEDPQGHGHIVQIGSRLGRNGGRVTAIASHGIQVVEDTTDPLGRRMRNKIDVPLPQSPVDADPVP